MKPSTQHPQRQTTIKTLKLFILFLLSSLTMHWPDSNTPYSHPTTLSLPTQFTDDDISAAAEDFGNRFHFPPSSVVRPESVSDIARTIKSVLEMGPKSELTLAARGHGHSLQGQAQAPGGIVVMTESLRRSGKAQVHGGNTEAPYIDVPAGELWIDVLLESLKHGFAPKSWTDYLHLTVGGTLSYGGISGQAFRHGPQISNIQRLEIVTGKGDVLNCSDSENADLFHGALGGLGQFGIITRAQIALEPAPTKVKWIRALYSDFASFVGDQEILISMEKTFDYIEGFVIINRTGLLNNWRSSFNPQDPVQASRFESDGRTFFCLEMTKNVNHDESGASNQEVGQLLSRLRFIPSTLFMSEVSYLEFLDRVHISEVQLRSKGLWEIPHPWLNLLVPRSRIHDFAEVVFGKILTENSNGPILIYPLNKSKWDNRTSAVIPNEEVFYLVALLSSAMDDEELARSLKRNSMILEFCDKADIGAKQYLPYFANQDEWRAHFGSRWKLFVQRKRAYDPFAILAPGQRIFNRATKYFS